MTEVRTMMIPVALLLLSACGDAADSTQAGSSTEREPAPATRSPEASREASDTTRQEIVDLETALARERRRSAGLESRNRALSSELAQARDQAARSTAAHRALHSQREMDVRQLRALGAEARSLRDNLASAHAQIRRLQASGPAWHEEEQRRRVATLARELEALRRHNGYLLQERGNLEAWLWEANATRSQREEALERAREAQSAADAANAGLRKELDAARRQVSTLTDARDALTDELQSLRAVAERDAQARERLTRELEAALARANGPAEPLPTAPGIPPAGRGTDERDATELRDELTAANARIARLRAARDYLVEKIEACTAAQRVRAAALGRGGPSARYPGPWRAPHGTRRIEFSAGLVHAQWRPGAPVDTSGAPRLIRTAGEDPDPAKGVRHEKELKETRQKLRELERSHAALQTKLDEVESELAAVRKQVETLTWANKELVKELDAAYASGKAGAAPDALPTGVRGMYVVRKGQSLSEIAKAFYGDPGRWPDLVAANEDKIPDPDRIDAGTVILIPD